MSPGGDGDEALALTPTGCWRTLQVRRCATPAMGWDMLITTRACAAVAVVVAVLASGCDTGFCADGEYAGTVVLTADGWRIDGTQGGLFTTGTPAETFAYADGSPFERCRVIGSISVRERGAQVDSDDYPLLEELGFFLTEPEDEGRTERIVGELAGFDNLSVFGGLSGANGFASINTISGFNGVEVVTGSLDTSAVVTGFARLSEVAGTLDVGNIPQQLPVVRVGGRLEMNGAFDTLDLPLLEEVGGDVIIESTRVAEIGFPVLRSVGGSVLIEGNSFLERWSGFARGAVILGDFSARINAPIRDEVFEDWLRDSQTEVRGRVNICANRPREEEGEPCR